MSHHHHEHCCCGHDHHHEHHHESERPKHGFTLDVHIHEGAVAAAGECTVAASCPECACKRIESGLQALANWVNGKNGIIGHIKASVQKTETRMYSITDKELAAVDGQTALHIKIAAIVYLVEPDELKNEMAALLRNIVTEE